MYRREDCIRLMWSSLFVGFQLAFLNPIGVVPHIASLMWGMAKNRCGAHRFCGCVNDESGYFDSGNCGCKVKNAERADVSQT